MITKTDIDFLNEKLQRKIILEENYTGYYWQGIKEDGLTEIQLDYNKNNLYDGGCSTNHRNLIIKTDLLFYNKDNDNIVALVELKDSLNKKLYYKAYILSKRRYVASF